MIRCRASWRDVTDTQICQPKASSERAYTRYMLICYEVHSMRVISLREARRQAAIWRDMMPYCAQPATLSPLRFLQALSRERYAAAL